MNLLEELKSKIDAADIWCGVTDLARGDFLKEANTKDTNLYFIQEGCIRAFIHTPEEELTIRFGYEGNLIAALDSFITDQPTSMCLQAIRRTKVRWVSKSAYAQFMDESPDTRRLWQQLLEMVVYQQLEREMDLLTASPKDRYERVLSRSPQLFQEVPHKYIASYLRMTPETLSRIKKS